MVDERTVLAVTDTPDMPLDNPGWEAVTWDRRHAHVLPLADLVEHGEDPDGDCVCGPSVTLDEDCEGDPYWLILHNSLDGRERFEP